MNRVSILFFILASSVGVLHAESPVHLPPITKWNAEWSKCSSDSDCELIFAGCYYVKAVNSAHKEEARSLLWEAYEDPTTLNCAPLKDETSYLNPKASCKSGICKP